MSLPLDLSYVLPVRRSDVPPSAALDEWCVYLAWLCGVVTDVVVTDASPAGVFDAVHRAVPAGVRHVRVSATSPNGKVDGVMAGLRLAREGRAVIADDDVRHSLGSLRRTHALLAGAHVVRPQNYFDPVPWHAQWDTARSLLNRMSGGDWPGTLGVQREFLLRIGGYSADVLFENLELARTVAAAGGTLSDAPDMYVRRLPPTTRQFFDQRIRQAYDELARFPRLLVQLAVLPSLLLALRRPRALVCDAGVVVVAAEAGRRRHGGAAYFPALASLWAPLWVLERSVTVWLALGSRVLLGGVRYRGRTIRTAAHSMRQLRHGVVVTR